MIVTERHTFDGHLWWRCYDAESRAVESGRTKRQAEINFHRRYYPKLLAMMRSIEHKLALRLAEEEVTE